MDRERAKAKYKEDQQYAARRKANAKKQGSKPEAAARKKAKAKLDSLNQEKVNAARSWRKKWRLMNKHVVVANTALYRAQKLKATPRWASSKAILAMYKEANEKTMQTEVREQAPSKVELLMHTPGKRKELALRLAHYEKGCHAAALAAERAGRGEG
jgi:hypothetical protein